jgi:transcriptional regulator GlxA family with amidase domain
MNRRELLQNTALGAIAASLAAPALATGVSTNVKPLQAPPKGKIPVAFLLAENAQVIDFTGPWEVFQDVHVPARGSSMDEMMPFELFTVAASKDPIECTGGLRVVPNYTFDNAPPAKVIVVPAQERPGGDTKEWLRAASAKSDVTMSVCTGAFVLGAAGLLDGLAATTYYRRLDKFAETFPKVNVKRGVRFVENEVISTSAGLSAGIDLALRVVERYFGREVATQTAETMEYEGKGWIV